MTRRKPAQKTIGQPRDEIGAAMTRSKLRSFGVAVICVYVALVPLVFDPAADWPFPIPKALLTHALAYVLAAVLIGSLLRFGRRAIPWSWLHAPVLLFLAINCVATILAADPYMALYGSHERMLGLGTIAAWTVLYFASVAFVRTRTDAGAVLAALLLGAMFMLAYEVVQVARLDPIHWNLDTASRPISTNGQATTLGSYLTAVAMAAFAVAVVVDILPRRARSAIVFLSIDLLCGAALTGTRSSLIGLALAAVTLVGLMRLRSATVSQRRLSLIAGGAAALVLVGLVAFTPIGSRLVQLDPATLESAQTGGTRLDVASLDVRGVLYGVALDAVRERPLFGYGPDNFTVAMERHRPEVGPEEARLSYATSAHGWIGQTAIASGVLGLAAFLAIVVVAFVRAVRSRQHAAPCIAAVIIAANLGTGLTTVSDVASDWLVWLAAAFIAGPAIPGLLSNLTEQASVVRGKRQRAIGGSWSIPDLVCIVAGTALALTAVGPMHASRSANASQNGRLAGSVAPAIRAALEATAADPGRAEYWHDLGLAYVANQRWRDAAVAFDHALGSAPWDARNIGDLLQVELVLAQDGDAAARARALQLADDIVRADPNHPDAQVARATALQFLGHYEAALNAIERAMVLLPGSYNERWFVMATQLYVAVDRPVDGVNIATRALTVVGATVPLRTELARALIASGRLGDALAQVDAILAVDPANGTAKQLRAQIESAIAR